MSHPIVADLHDLLESTLAPIHEENMMTTPATPTPERPTYDRALEILRARYVEIYEDGSVSDSHLHVYAEALLKHTPEEDLDNDDLDTLAAQVVAGVKAEADFEAYLADQDAQARSFGESGDDHEFNGWLQQVDDAMTLQCGMDTREVPDADWWGWFDEGLSPAQAVTRYFTSFGG